MVMTWCDQFAASTCRNWKVAAPPGYPGIALDIPGSCGTSPGTTKDRGALESRTSTVATGSSAIKRRIAPRAADFDGLEHSDLENH